MTSQAELEASQIKLDEAYKKIKQLILILSRQPCSFVETQEICQILGFTLAKPGKNNIVYERNIVVFQSPNLKGVLDFCCSRLI